MRRKKFTPRFFIVIAAVVAICLLSALYSGVTGNQSPVTKVIGIVVTPLQKLGTSIGGVFGRGHEYFFEVDELKAENVELRQRVAELEQKERDATVALEENDRLRSQLGMEERSRDYTLAVAEVIGRNPGDWATVLTLDKGSSRDVAVNDLVTTEEGMVGYVSAVAPNYCEVTSVIDVEMQCGALITRTREAAIAEGDYTLMTDGNLRLSYLKEGADIVVGDTVETSGRGGVFPKGIMIGTVESVLPEEDGVTYYAVIKPFVDVESVTNVNIITDYTITE